MIRRFGNRSGVGGFRSLVGTLSTLDAAADFDGSSLGVSFRCHNLLGLFDFGGLGIENLIGDLPPPLAETGSVEVECHPSIDRRIGSPRWKNCRAT